jgi:hypothetical protein
LLGENTHLNILQRRFRPIANDGGAHGYAAERIQLENLFVHTALHNNE